MARVGIVGLWHLGCIAAAGLAHLGHTVRATDFDAEVVRKLQQGVAPIYEPGLTKVVADQMRARRLTFVETCREAFDDADWIFITFDTPVDANDQSDLSVILGAVDAIASDAKDARVIVMSQVPVGTCQQLAARLSTRSPRRRFELLYHPENLRLGAALQTFLQPDFLLVGAEEPASAEHLFELYDGVNAPRLIMSLASAEMAKHALNAFLATSISFVNELAKLAEASGADVRDVVRVLRHDRRVGPQAFLSPGPGFGGGTLGRDVQALRRLGARAGRKTLHLDATLAVNDACLPGLVEKIRDACGDLHGLQVGLLGLTYKPGTDTLRRSHALALAKLLRAEGAQVRAYDPRVSQPQPTTAGITLCRSPFAAAQDADALVVITPWPEFKALDLGVLLRGMHQGVLVDAHNCLDERAARAVGFHYCGVGIPETTTKVDRAVAK